MPGMECIIGNRYKEMLDKTLNKFAAFELNEISLIFTILSGPNTQRLNQKGLRGEKLHKWIPIKMPIIRFLSLLIHLCKAQVFIRHKYTNDRLIRSICV